MSRFTHPLRGEGGKWSTSLLWSKLLKLGKSIKTGGIAVLRCYISDPFGILTQATDVNDVIWRDHSDHGVLYKLKKVKKLWDIQLLDTLVTRYSLKLDEQYEYVLLKNET